MGFKCGIVGLPNVGKSTLFNALTSSVAAQVANYPFCTIEPNVGVILVPDERISVLANISSSAKLIPTQIEFVDIAGLVHGASSGEGLGNRFLSHIRNCDAIVHVLRCFNDDSITHISGSVNPLRDIDIIETELMLADLDSLERYVYTMRKRTSAANRDAKVQMSVIELLLDSLRAGKPVRSVINSIDPKKTQKEQYFHLLSAKPVLYVCNVDNTTLNDDYVKLISRQVETTNAEVLTVAAALEAELATQLVNTQDRTALSAELGITETGLSKLIKASYKLLNLITFFTVGDRETRAWTIPHGAKAPEAGGVIHSDFEHWFIRAETIAYNDFVAYKGEHGAREAGRVRSEGRNYVVNDGDVLHFLFNKTH